MKMTLLEMVQEILSSMDSDEVNSVSDTTEAEQVAMCVRRAYLDICSRLNLNEHFDFFQLTASGSASLPTIMYRPDAVNQLLWVKYDKALSDSDPDEYQDVRYMEPETFMQRMYGLDASATNVSTTTLTVNSDTIPLAYRTDAHPNYWTSVDDYTLIFDAYYSTLDTTLQKSKTVCYGLLEPSFDIEDDDFTPDLDSQQFSLLFNDAKSLAWAELKQTVHARSEREAKRQLIQAQKNKRALPSKHVYGDFNNLPDYGRK